jgi:hypothetical protein
MGLTIAAGAGKPIGERAKGGAGAKAGAKVRYVLTRFALCVTVAWSGSLYPAHAATANGERARVPSSLTLLAEGGERGK